MFMFCLIVSDGFDGFLFLHFLCRLLFEGFWLCLSLFV